MLEAFFPGAAGAGHNPFHFPGLGEEHLRQEACLGRKVVQGRAGGTLLRRSGYSIRLALFKVLSLCRLYIRFMDMAFANHLPMESTGNKTRRTISSGFGMFLCESIEPSCPHRDGRWAEAYTSAKGRFKYPACQVQHRLGQLNETGNM